MKMFGTSYYLASKFFPRSIRHDVFTLYEFVRIPDQIVDSWQWTSDERFMQCNELYQQRLDARSHKDINHKLYGPMVKLVDRVGIDIERTKAFFEAMLSDTKTKRYETYEQLQHYMFWSAEVIGLMLCKICHADEQWYKYARKLGEAMQMTNFLRDIKEDYCEFDRIYLPEEDLHRYGLSYKHIKEFCHTKEINSNFVAYMQYAISKCDYLYEEALDWLCYLPRNCQKAVLLWAKLYQGILRKIQKKQYNVFIHSTKTTQVEKILIALKYVLYRPKNT